MVELRAILIAGGVWTLLTVLLFVLLFVDLPVRRRRKP